MITENGWPSCTRAQCDDVRIPGTTLVLPFQHGLPAIVLPAFLACLNQFVESANNARGYQDEGSYTETNSVFSSNHKGATAFDFNWFDHPMGIALDGWHGSDIIPGEQEPEIRRILQYFRVQRPDGSWIQIVFWGNDWNSPKDSMHFQMGYGTYEDQILVWQWVNEHIDKDGFALYRRDGQGQGGAPIPQADLSKIIGDAFGNVPGVDYDAMEPYVVDALVKSKCMNNNRIAMWFAQIGHESVGLKYMKEIGDAAYFSKYNNRSDLGNGPSDGPRYPGRGPIQITGRNNYRQLSAWAYSQGYVSTPTYFEDNPVELEKLQYAFLGAIWYWTVARSDINALCDAGDIVTVTKRINGGTNGLDDRTNRWNRCKTMDLTPLIEEDDFMSALTADEQREVLFLLRVLAKNIFPSRSPMRHLGEGGVDTVAGFSLNTDGSAHLLRVKASAEAGHIPDIGTLIEIASAADDPVKWDDRQEDAALAKLILAGLPDDAKAAGWDYNQSWFDAEDSWKKAQDAS